MTIRPWDSPFPEPERHASDEGVVAVGAGPTPDLLVEAYTHGIFPWPHDDMPLLWFSPDPRFVLYPAHARAPRSVRKAMRRTTLTLRADTAFEAVIDGCQSAHRPGQRGTWITDELREGFVALHRAGVAHSIEMWDDATLVGGFYGLSFGRAFMGESMFARVPDASKIAFATFAIHAFDTLNFDFIDCQVQTEHTERFGGIDVPRADFLDELHHALSATTQRGPWTIETTPAHAAKRYGQMEARRQSAPAVVPASHEKAPDKADSGQ